MAWNTGFFNSVNGDRLYNADSFNEFFEGLITNGVFYSVGNKLAVQPNSGMVVQVATGKGFFNKHWVSNTSEKLITLEPSSNILNRYAGIVVRVDESTAVRDVQCVVKYSDFATDPERPELTRSELINEYCLGYVFIRAGATEITASDIEDTRPDEALCGWVTGLIDQLDSNTLFTQFKDQFNTWFNGLVDIIDADVETRLVNALPTSVTVNLLPNGWSGSAGDYTQDVTVTNMNTSKTVVVQAETDSQTDYNSYGVKCVAQSSNTLTFRAIERPESNLQVNIVFMGV